MWAKAKTTIKVFESIKDALESMYIFPNKLDRIMAHNIRSNVYTPKQTCASTFALHETLQGREKIERERERRKSVGRRGMGSIR